MQLLSPLPAPWNAQLGYALNAGVDPGGVSRGTLVRVAGTPALSLGNARKYLSSVTSRPVNRVFSGLKNSTSGKRIRWIEGAVRSPVAIDEAVVVGEVEVQEVPFVDDFQF